jgi:cytochrome c5
MKRITIILSVFLLTACGSSKLITPTQADVDREKFNNPGLTLAQLELGMANYRTYCNVCHELYSPTSHNAEQWQAIVPDMVQKNNGRPQGEKIDPATEESILTYLITMSAK